MPAELSSAVVQPQAAQPLAPQALPSPLDAVAAGQLPAAVLPPIQPNQPPDPTSEFVIQNFDKLESFGLQAFEAPDLSTVIFNPKLLPADKVEAAAKSGTLDQLLNPPQVAPADAGAVAQQAAQGRELAPVQAAPAPVAPPLPASTQTQLAKMRVRALGQGGQKNPIVANPVGNQLAKRAV